MAKVLGVHEVELSDQDPAEFERLASAVVAGTWPGGITFRLFKADRGTRDGTYLLLIEIDSVEVRDRIFPKSTRRRARPGTGWSAVCPRSTWAPTTWRSRGRGGVRGRTVAGPAAGSGTGRRSSRTRD